MGEICPTTRIESLLLATDVSEFNEGAVREAVKLAKKCSGKLSVVAVAETNAEFDALAPQIVEKKEKAIRQHLEAVQARAKKEGVACDITVRHGEEAYQLIVDEAAKQSISMIIMGRRGRTGISRLMMGSTTARVIGYASCNILVVPRSGNVEFKNILIATDGSRFGEAAAAEAVGIAKRCGSKLTALAVVPSESGSPMDIVQSQMERGMIVERELKDSEQNVRKVKEAAQREGVAIEALVVSGRPSEVILQTAKEKKADLIVMGSHGRTGIEKLLIGSVAERVIVLSECAVLVVKSA